MIDQQDPTIRALIVAFDDVLVTTRGLRMAALHEGCVAERLPLPPERLAELVGLRSIGEATAMVWPETHEDPTRTTLIGMRATALFARRMAQGAPFDAEAVQRVVAAANGGCRIVVRADSPRAIVSRALEATPLADAISLLVCADDVGAGPLERVWALIDQRLARVGIPVAARLAVECRPDALPFASHHAARVDVWNPNSPVSYFPA